MKLFTSKVLQESMEVESLYLARTVLVDFYYAAEPSGAKVPNVSEPEAKDTTDEEQGTTLRGRSGRGTTPGRSSLVRGRGGCGISGVGPETSLLLINDGQELGRLGLADILEELGRRDGIKPLLCVGIHAG